MVFNKKEDFILFLKNLTYIGSGSQAVVYLDKNIGKVFKVFHQFFDEEYDEDYYCRYVSDDILKFSHIKNKTFIWPSSVIVVEDEVVGYIRDYVNAKPLCEINPLNVSLDKLSSTIPIIQKDIETISNNGVMTYDMMYNTLYGDNGFRVIDHDDYTFSNKHVNELIKINNDSLNYEIMYFLVDRYFNEFIYSNKLLREMYDKPGVDIMEFISLFRKYLSEYVGSDVKRLRDAKECINKNKKYIKKYERNLFSQR